MKNIFTFIYLLICMSSLNSQEIVIRVEIETDEFPQDIFWEIVDPSSNILETQSLENCDAFSICSKDVALPGNVCYGVIIRDVVGDGIAEPGSYNIYVDNQLIVSGREFGDKIQHDINCGRGESCEQAIEVNLPDNDIYAPDDKEYWFKLVPEETGLYRINTCLNVVTGEGWADTQLWVYDRCDRDIVTDGPEGALAFSDDFIDCEPGSGFNVFPLDEGVSYYIRHKPLHTWYDSLEIRIQKLPSVLGCTDMAACNFNPFANTDNGNCVYDAGCAADLLLDQEELERTIFLDQIQSNDDCLVTEGCLRGPGLRDVIRFSTKIDNIGDSDYIVGIPEDNPVGFSNNNCHGHWHHDGYAQYLLFDGSGNPEPIGFKTGFCVLDLACESGLTKYICSYMGISAGCSDIYDVGIECQWIDVTDVPDGEYTLVVRVNWSQIPDLRGIHEKTYDNNSGQVCFTLDRSSGELEFEIIEECQPYQDCLGITNGPAEIDCNGVCGGNAHFGDFNESGKIDNDDLNFYYDAILSNSQDGLSCYDLNGDNNISAFDVALAIECIEGLAVDGGNPFHSHCQFPNGIFNTEETVSVRIGEHNSNDRYVDLEFLASDRNISAYELGIEGLQVDRVELLYEEEAEELIYNSSKIIGIHRASILNRNSEFSPLLRIYYKDVTSDVCITSVEFVNEIFEKVSTINDGECLIISSSEDINVENISLLLSPNPSVDILYVESSEIISRVEVFDLQGKRIYMVDSTSNDQELSIDLLDWIEGTYFLRMTTKKGDILSKRFTKMQE